jgi:hypothetical protein
VADDEPRGGLIKQIVARYRLNLEFGHMTRLHALLEAIEQVLKAPSPKDY